MESNELAMFLYSRNKAYVTRRDDHASWYDACRRELAGTPLVVERYFQEFQVPPSYFQLPDVVGLPVLLCVHEDNFAIAQELVRPSRLSAGQPRSRGNAIVRRIARDWMPPWIHRRIARRIDRPGSA